MRLFKSCFIFGCLIHVAADLQAFETAPTERFGVHGQFTYVRQWTSDFNAPYSGPNSLSPRTTEGTADLTLYLGARIGSGTEVWINPEIDQGFGLDATLGAAGFPSGEAYKVGKSHPYLKLPRLFLRQSIDLAGERETLAGAANQLGGERSANRLVVTIGKFGVGDIFDVNQYAHDPRGDFLNWTAIDAGSFDYAADAWGYTVGAAVEWNQGGWSWRTGFFDLSDVPNSEHLEPGFHEWQGIIELEKRHQIGGHPGKWALTVFDSRGRMGLLDEAVRVAANNATPVDVSAVRRFRSRLGVHLNLEQQLAADLGVFARIGKAQGNVEAYEFTDIDRSVSAGLSIKGMRWRRDADSLGIAGIVNGISAERQRYLAAGGLGILVGDGRLPHPGPEQIVETYYSASVCGRAQLSVEYQWIDHPAYNRDRGPTSVFGLRFHAQF
jgi:high affinity Mn2+ porin